MRGLRWRRFDHLRLIGLPEQVKKDDGTPSDFISTYVSATLPFIPPNASLMRKKCGICA
jgi:hypothetical protein